MTDYYYLQKDGEKIGPYNFDELTDMGLEVNDLLMEDNGSKWKPASDMPEFYDYFRWRGYLFPTEDNLAGFWWRALAYLLDMFIVVTIAYIAVPDLLIKIYNAQLTGDTSEAQQMARVQFNLLVLGIATIYNSILEATPLRGSIGKKICRLSVVDANGQRLTFLRALARNAGKIVSNLVFYVGSLNILWDEHKQAWHDQWARTYVVINNPSRYL